MQNLIYRILEHFQEPEPKVYPLAFKNLEYNQIQQILFRALKKIGLKPYITSHLFPKYKGKEVCIDEVHIINNCKVTVTLSNPNNSLFIIVISGNSKDITTYKDKLNSSSQLLLEKHGIKIQISQKDFDKKPSQLTITQYISSITDIPTLIRETLTPLK